MNKKRFGMKMGQGFLLIFFLACFSNSSQADTYEPIPHCYKPDKPLIFASRHYKDRYTLDIEEYKLCLKAFIERQEYAAKMHMEAAKNALKVWNDFASQQ